MQWNLYGYVGGVPLIYNDPSGLTLTVHGNPQQIGQILDLLDLLCPEAGGFTQASGRIQPKTKDFFKDRWECRGTKINVKKPGPYARGKHPKSCECIGDAINGFTHYRIIPRVIEIGPIYAPEIIPVEGSRTDRNGPFVIDVKIGKPSPPYTGTGDPELGIEGRVRAPQFITLGHELCGHAVPGDDSEMGAIDVENELRDEHGIPGERDGFDHKKKPDGTW